MKKTLLFLWPFLVPVFLLLLLVGNGVVSAYAAEEETTRWAYRPAIRYNDQIYLITSGKTFRHVEKQDMTSVGILANDLPADCLPTENMQSCGCSFLVDSSIYIHEEYPAYLFLYDEEGDIVPFVLESKR